MMEGKSGRKSLWLLGLVVGLAVLWLGLPRILDEITAHHLNERFPPTSTADARAAAINLSSEGLSGVNSPSLVFSVSSHTLATLVTGAMKAAGTGLPIAVAQLTTHTGSQQISFTSNFSGKLEAYSAAVSGTAEGTVSVATTAQGVRLTPNLERVQVSSLTVSGWHLPGNLSAALGDELTKFIANVNGQIKPISLDFGSRLASAQTLSIGGHEVNIPAQSITASSILIDSDRLIVLTQINGVKAQSGGPATVDFETFKASFIAKGTPLLTGVPKDGLALSPDFLKALLAGLATPMTPQERANASLVAAWQSVHHLAGPDLSLILPAADINSSVAPMLQKALAEAAAKANIVLIDSHFILADGRLGVLATATADLPKPLTGKVTFRIGISGSPVSGKGSISLLPTLDEVEIVKVETNKFDPGDLVTGVNTVLSGLVGGVTQALPSIPIDVRPVEIAAVDLKEAANKTPGLDLEPAVIPATQASLAGAAILIASDGIQILADVDLASPNLAVRPAGADPAPFSGKIQDLKRAFDDLRTSRLKSEPTDKTSVDVSWARLAQIVNAKWKDLGGIRATYNFDTGSQSMTPTEIRLVEKPTYTCSQRPCSFESCSFHSDADSHCSLDACDLGCTQGICGDVPCPTWREPLRTCQKCTGDFTCEPRRAACLATRDARYGVCRASYDVPANAAKSACDARANAQKAICDGIAVADKAACDAGNAIQAALSQVGGIGRIAGDGRAQGVAAADTSALSMTVDQPGLSFAPKIAASVKVSGSIDFTPYDVGHFLVCPLKGKAFFSMNVGLPSQQPGVSASLMALPDDPTDPQTLNLTGHIGAFNLKAKIQPPPIEALLTQNPQLLVECNPVLGGTFASLAVVGKAVGLTGSDILKALAGKNVSAVLTGDVDYDVNGFDLPLKIKALDLTVGDLKLKFQPRLFDKVVGMTVVTSPQVP
jgi:hypothetical protein